MSRPDPAPRAAITGSCAAPGRPGRRRSSRAAGPPRASRPARRARARGPVGLRHLQDRLDRAVRPCAGLEPGQKRRARAAPPRRGGSTASVSSSASPAAMRPMAKPSGRRISAAPEPASTSAISPADQGRGTVKQAAWSRASASGSDEGAPTAARAVVSGVTAGRAAACRRGTPRDRAPPRNHGADPRAALVVDHHELPNAGQQRAVVPEGRKRRRPARPAAAGRTGCRHAAHQCSSSHVPWSPSCRMTKPRPSEPPSRSAAAGRTRAACSRARRQHVLAGRVAVGKVDRRELERVAGARRAGPKAPSCARGRGAGLTKRPRGDRLARGRRVGRGAGKAGRGRPKGGPSASLARGEARHDQPRAARPGPLRRAPSPPAASPSAAASAPVLGDQHRRLARAPEPPASRAPLAPPRRRGRGRGRPRRARKRRSQARRAPTPGRARRRPRCARPGKGAGGRCRRRRPSGASQPSPMPSSISAQHREQPLRLAPRHRLAPLGDHPRRPSRGRPRSARPRCRRPGSGDRRPTASHGAPVRLPLGAPRSPRGCSAAGGSRCPS